MFKKLNLKAVGLFIRKPKVDSFYENEIIAMTYACEYGIEITITYEATNSN
jgi:hypothetical protein